MKGLVGLLRSRKATLCLIILAIGSVALFLGKLDSTAYAAIVSSVVLIYNYTVHKLDLAAQSNDIGAVVNSVRNSIQGNNESK